MGASRRSVKQAIARKVEFLSNPDVRRWYQNIKNGSPTTAEVYRRSLALFLRRMHLDYPSDLLGKSEKETYDLLLDFVAGENRLGHAGGSTVTHIKAVKSWLLHNGIKIDQKVKVEGAEQTPTLKNEMIPTQAELHRILLAATPRTRVAVALMGFSGVRPEVLGNFAGNDGLRLSDLTDLQISEDGKVFFTRTPATVVVRPELSKTRHRYFSFIGEEGCGYIVDYLSQRLAFKEKLTGDSDLIHAEADMETPKRFLRSQKIGDAIRKAIRLAGYQLRPYVLRGYFDTNLLLSESKGKVAHDYRVFWMGHKGSMEARYTTNKGRLPQSLIDDMREAYHRCEPFLSTIPVKGGTEDVLAQVRREMLIGLGHSEEDLAKADLSDPKVFQEMVKGTQKAAAGPPQEIVGESEIPSRLAHGWTYVASFNSTGAIMQRPQ